MKIKMHECSGVLQQRGRIPLVLNCTSTALRKKPSQTEALKTKFPQLILDSKVSKWGFLKSAISERVCCTKNAVELRMCSIQGWPFFLKENSSSSSSCCLKMISSAYKLFTFDAEKES